MYLLVPPNEVLLLFQGFVHDHLISIIISKCITFLGDNTLVGQNIQGNEILISLSPTEYNLLKQRQNVIK